MIFIINKPPLGSNSFYILIVNMKNGKNRRRKYQIYKIHSLSYISISKKNHNTLIEISKKYVDMFKQYGVLQHDVFQLVKPDEDKQYFNHLDKVVSANLQDEEVWIEIIHYKDKNH
jgi:hypothetical protein